MPRSKQSPKHCFSCFLGFFAFFWFWAINHSKFYVHWKRLVYGQQKANMVLDHVMHSGKPNCLLRAHNKPACMSNRKGLCMDNKKRKIM
jgi:hypothetical protein